VAQGLAVDPAGTAVWVTSYGEGALTRVEIAGGSVRVAARGLAGPQALALDPSGRFAYVVESATGSIARVDLETGAATLAATGLDARADWRSTRARPAPG